MKEAFLISANYCQDTDMARTLSTAIKSPIIQYLIGLLLNCFFILILISNDISYQNLQTPEGIYSENLWQGSDVLTYVRPARNFVHDRIFGYGTIPDHRRTVGYPLFLSTLMMLFGSHWLMFALFTQAAIFALIYPSLTRISKILFSSNDNVVILSFLFFILAGTYIVRVPVILTDTFFTVFFMLGLWLGLDSIVKKSFLYMVLHVICIGYAAQVRPLLSLYPIVNYFILTATARKYELSRDTRVHQLVITSSIALLIICNLPSIRNYINHAFPKPSHLFSDAMLNVLGRNVLVSVGRIDEYEAIQKTLQGITDINEKMRLQEKSAIKVYKDYPLATLEQLVRNAIVMMGRSHWPLAAHFWGYSYKDDFGPVLMLKESMIVFFIEIFFNLVYLVVSFLFVCFLIRTLRSKNILFLLAIVLCVGNFLIPALIYRWGGSRTRLPAEGLIVIMAFCELGYHVNALKDKLVKLINGRDILNKSGQSLQL